MIEAGACSVGNKGTVLSNGSDLLLYSNTERTISGKFDSNFLSLSSYDFDSFSALSGLLEDENKPVIPVKLYCAYKPEHNYSAVIAGNDVFATYIRSGACTLFKQSVDGREEAFWVEKDNVKEFKEIYSAVMDKRYKAVDFLPISEKNNQLKQILANKTSMLLDAKDSPSFTNLTAAGQVAFPEVKPEQDPLD